MTKIERHRRKEEDMNEKNRKTHAQPAKSFNPTSGSFADRLLSMKNINASEKALFITDLLGAGELRFDEL